MIKSLDSKLRIIIYDMFVDANNILVEEKLSERNINREIGECERQGSLEQMRKGELQEVKLLQQVVTDWDEAQRIRTFADCMEKASSEITDEVKKEKILKWLEGSRNKTGWLDPLVAKRGDLLGENKHILDRINEIGL